MTSPKKCNAFCFRRSSLFGRYFFNFGFFWCAILRVNYSCVERSSPSITDISHINFHYSVIDSKFRGESLPLGQSMNAIFIAFVCATLLTVRLPIVILPSTVAGLCLFSPIALFALTKARSQFFGAFYLGFLYVVFNTHQWLDASLPPELEQKTMVIEGYVLSLIHLLRCRRRG